MIYGSVCSGIEAASVAWHPLGWRAAWLAEIEPFPSAVLAHHYPEVPNLGDMTTIADKIISGEVDAPEVLVGGTPCQAFSVAGLRNSLDDARGQLSLEYIRLLNAIDAARIIHDKPAAIAVWENVPGVLSTKDNAFGCFLAGLAGEDEPLVPSGEKWTNAGCVYGPKRAVAWRVLDAQYFGLAQRRRRVFVIASARDGFSPAEVLFEFGGVRRDIAPSRKAGQEIAGTISSRTTGGGGLGTDFECAGELQSVTTNRMVAFGEYSADGTASTMKQRDYKDATDLVAYSVALRGRDGGATAELGNAVAGCSRASGSGGDKANVLALSYNGNGRDATVDLSPTLSCNHESPIAFDSRQECISSNHVFGSLGSSSPQARAIAYGIPGNWIGRAPENGGNGTTPMLDVAPCLTKSDQHGVSHGMAVRRLTPVECARLQGFPDTYLDITVRGKPAADSPKYKSLGNSMAVPCMSWLGKRIQQAVTNHAYKVEISRRRVDACPLA